MSENANDGFVPGEPPLPLAAALTRLREATAAVVGTEERALNDCLGRVLARPLTATRNVPAFDNAAVDGWAFAQDGDGPRWLEITPGRAAAGHPADAPVDAGCCLRVLTGAPMPAGTDTVALQEEVRVAGGRALMPAGLKRGANRRRAGEDIRGGSMVLAAGTVLAAQHLGVAAETGSASLTVFRPLRVGLFSTGDELAEPGAPLAAGGVYDANRVILRALLACMPVTISDLGILPDRADAVADALVGAAAGHDLLLTSGGASRGDEDHVVATIRRHGRLDLWQIAMKPGRPLVFGRIGETALIGLPGNPVAVMACFAMLARPAILQLAGAAWVAPRSFPVTSGFAMRKRPGRTELVRCRLEPTADGLTAHKIPRQGSGVLTTMLEATGFVVLDEAASDVAEGAVVPYLPFTELLHATEPA